MKQVHIHDSISHVRWAGALMEVKELFGLNFAVKKTGERRTDRWTDGRTDGPTDGQTDRWIKALQVVGLQCEKEHKRPYTGHRQYRPTIKIIRQI